MNYEQSFLKKENGANGIRTHDLLHAMHQNLITMQFFMLTIGIIYG